MTKRVLMLAVACAAVAGFAETKTVEMRTGEKWWGVMNYYGTKMPFDAATDLTMDLCKDNNSNQSASLLLSDSGRFVWCDEQTVVTIRGGKITMTSKSDPIELDESGKTLREAYLKAMARHFPPSGKVPDLMFFSAPQYNTWIELTYHQNEKDILAYAKSMLDNGLPAGVLMIDDTWQYAYGTWEFDPRRFTDPKGMVKKLHAMGFKVMLWMCPFVSLDSPEFRRIEWASNPDDVKGWPTKGGFLTDGGKPAAVQWWNGYSALLDLTHPNANAWFTEQLDRLVRDFGVDGFKFDGGEVGFYSRGYRAHDPNASSGAQSQAYSAYSLKYPVCENRNCFRFQNVPVVERLHALADQRNDVALGRLVAHRDLARHIGKAHECILVGRGRGLFLELQAQHIGGALGEVLIEVVALVDGQRKRLILGHGQLLHGVLHFGGRAVAVCALTDVIDLIDGHRGVHLERFHAGQIEGRRGLALDKGTAAEGGRDFVRILGCEIDCHKKSSPLCIMHHKL